jgi:Zn-dependent metalloprotease
VVASLKRILNAHIGLGGRREGLNVAKVGRDWAGNTPVCIRAAIDGIPVELASITVHLAKNGTVVAVNGEIVSAVGVDTNINVDCQRAFEATMRNHLYVDAVRDATWLIDECTLTFVWGRNGTIHQAWVRTLQYTRDQGSSMRRKDCQDRSSLDRSTVAINILYASTVNGKLVAAQPKVRGLLSSLETFDFGNQNACTRMVTNGSVPIRTGDPPVDAAHNLGLEVLSFYQFEFNRNSFDHRGSTLVSHARFVSRVKNAWYDSDFGVFYGGGDGVNVLPLSL